jgi:hypothetical protein
MVYIGLVHFPSPFPLPVGECTSPEKMDTQLRSKV